MKSLAARLHKQKFVCVRRETLRPTKIITVRFAARINNDKTTRLAQIIMSDVGSGVSLQSPAVEFVTFITISAIVTESSKVF